jgi:hypothetical protein
VKSKGLGRGSARNSRVGTETSEDGSTVQEHSTTVIALVQSIAGDGVSGCLHIVVTDNVLYTVGRKVFHARAEALKAVEVWLERRFDAKKDLG